MYVYDIYEHPEHGLEAVRRGFSWSAFFMPTVWAVNRGLGMTTLVLLVATTAVFDLAKVLSAWAANPFSAAIIALGLIALLGIRPGVMGNRWHAEALGRDGYVRRDTVAAMHRAAALRAWSDEDFLPEAVHLAASA